MCVRRKQDTYSTPLISGLGKWLVILPDKYFVMANALNTIVAVASAASGIATVVSAVKVSSRGNTISAKEYDDHERGVKVYLFTSRLSPFPNATEFHHWALVLEFEGNDIRTVEGLVNEETELYAVFTKEQPKEEGKYYLLGNSHLSPKKVLDLCESNKYNHTEYLPTWQNCQTWVKELAKKLGEDIASELDRYPVLKEARPVFASFGKCITASSNFSSRPFHKSFNSSKASSGPNN